MAWSLVFLSLVTMMFFARLGDLYSRIWLAGFFGAGLLSLYVSRLMLYGKVRRWSREGRLDRRAVLVGTGSQPVRLGDVQAPGKRRMTASDWARGLRSGAPQPSAGTVRFG